MILPEYDKFAAHVGVTFPLPKERVASVPYTDRDTMFRAMCGYALWAAMYDEQYVLLVVPKRNDISKVTDTLGLMLDGLPADFVSPKMKYRSAERFEFDNRGCVRIGFINSCIGCGLSIDTLLVFDQQRRNQETVTEFWTGMIPTLCCGGNGYAVHPEDYTWDRTRRSR